MEKRIAAGGKKAGGPGFPRGKGGITGWKYPETGGWVAGKTTDL